MVAEPAKRYSMEEFTEPVTPQVMRKPGSLEELGGCTAPRGIRDRAKYRDTCKTFSAQVRKARINPETIDFDQEIYDDNLSKGEIRNRIRSRVWSSSSGPEQDEYQVETYEERTEIPRKEYDRLLRAEEQKDAFMLNAVKWKGCAQATVKVCRRVGKVGYGTLQKEVIKIKNECPGDYRGILRKKQHRR